MELKLPDTPKSIPVLESVLPPQRQTKQMDNLQLTKSHKPSLGCNSSKDEVMAALAKQTPSPPATSPVNAGAPLPLEQIFPGSFGAQWPQPRAFPTGPYSRDRATRAGTLFREKVGGKKPRLPNCTTPAMFLFPQSYIHQLYSCSEKSQVWQDASPCSSDIQMLCQLDGQPAIPPGTV